MPSSDFRHPQRDSSSTAPNAGSWLQLAQAKGWVPVPLPNTKTEPSLWLIGALMVLLMLCAGSMLGLMVALLDELKVDEIGVAYVLGALMWLGGLILLRRAQGVFKVCLGAVGILTASFWLGGVALLDDTPLLLVCVGEAIALGFTLLLARPSWIALLASTLIVGWVLVGLVNPLAPESHVHVAVTVWLACIVMALLWAALVWFESSWMGRADSHRWGAVADGVCFGLMLSVVVWNIAWRELAWMPPDQTSWSAQVMPWMAVAIAAGCGVLWLMRWRRLEAVMSTRDLAPPLIALVTMAAACWLQPWLAPVVVVATLSALTGRWRWVAASGVVALGLLSSFYYDLAWPLTTKAMGLAVLGASLLTLLAGSHVANQRLEATTAVVRRVDAPPDGRALFHAMPRIMVILGVLACIAALNWDVLRKERVVQHGETLLVALEPVDPRSLMQGDYMDLRFDIPESVRKGLDALPNQAVVRHADAVVQVQDGRARIVRLARSGEVLASDERRMPLKRLKSQWVLVTDAYFFPEGDAERFEQAKWGEFRLLPDGRALLVGLSDETGRAIASPHDLRNPMW